MKHQRSRGSRGWPVQRDLPDDELDEEIWERLTAAIAAGSRGEPDEMARYWSEHEQRVSDDQRGLVGIYVWYILQYLVIDTLGHVPTVSDLRELASDIYPKFAPLIVRDEDYLVRVLMSIFNLVSPEHQVKGGEIVISGSAVISSLLEGSSGELTSIRPHLSQWLKRNRANLGELGITHD